MRSAHARYLAGASTFSRSRSLCLAVTVAASMLVAACAAPSASPANTPPRTPAESTSSQAAPATLARADAMGHAEAVTMGPPTSHCPALVSPALVAAARDKDDAPVTMTAGAKGITLETSGASAGRVLAAIALASKVPIEVHGAGASVRIYARVRDAQPEALLRVVAQVAGLDFAAASGGFVAGHARTGPEIERRMRAARIASAALETRLLPTRDAVAMANVLALTVLSCRGLVTAAPERGLVVVTDVREVLDRSSQVVDALDSAPPKPLRAEMDPVRGPASRPRAPRCASAPATAAPNGAAGKLSAEGTAAGDLLVRVARAKNEDVVVGCGGDLPAYFAPGSAAPTVADAARAVGMVAEGTNAYASTELAVAQQAHAGTTPAARADEKHELRTFTAPHVRELAAAADDLLGDPAAAAAYEPASMLVVSASASEVAVIERLVQAWTTTH